MCQEEGVTSAAIPPPISTTVLPVEGCYHYIYLLSPLYYLYFDNDCSNFNGGVYSRECCLRCSPGDSGGVQTGSSDGDQADNENKDHQGHLQQLSTILVIQLCNRSYNL